MWTEGGFFELLASTVLSNRTWVFLPTKSKAKLLTLGCGEGEYSIYCGAQQEVGEVHVQKTWTPSWFPGEGF